ncbi:MAG TPA: hypothetical protein DDW88_06170 [Treponema sp.]|nr:hypothetical protein [Treponema sp.]
MTKKILTLSFAFLILISFVFTSCAKNEEKEFAKAAEQLKKYQMVEKKESEPTTQEVKTEAKKEGPMALDFTLQMTDGTEFTLLQNLDKPILVNYWATWCPPCVREFPDLEEMYKNYKDRMHFVAINSAETKDVIEAFMAKNKFTIPVAMDSDNAVGMMYGIASIPTTFIVDIEGRIVFAQLGMMTKKQMQNAIEAAL